MAQQMAQIVQEISQGDQGQFSQDVDIAAQSISSTPQAVGNLGADVRNIEKRGLTPPAGVSASINTSEQAASQLTVSVNADIDTENSLVADAYSMADSIARYRSSSSSSGTYSGSCQASAPGQPGLLKHVSQ